MKILNAVIWTIAGALIFILMQAIWAKPAQQAPQPMKRILPTFTPTPTQARTKGTVYKGVASYYSRAGCVGCSPTLTMANGETLDDNAITVAYNHAPLNSYVSVTNDQNGKTVTARVTDTGGFNRLGRIIDLTPATKSAIACNDLCHVTVAHQK